ncbi:GntR family transcriptional regulator [Haliea sp.]|mgnify:CR=1 FL=1|uniref:GntR family transcriptional regulator n=1 Tax=Haliea sp. TaxID=1932666 RepID=UPI0025C4A4B0|nr:GntR family transcriptional regulator [Haliea sp.]
MQWHDEQPIYRQLRDLVVERIMDGSFAEGAAVPSVRQVASDYRINHLTVARAYQELVETGLLEKRRGLGMYVTLGARATLTADEQAHFFARELPAFAERVRNLGLDMQQVTQRLLQEGDIE